MYTLLLFALSFEWGSSAERYHDVVPPLKGLSIERPIQIDGFRSEQLCRDAAEKIQAGLLASRRVGYTIEAGGKRYDYDLAGKDLTFVCVKAS